MNVLDKIQSAATFPEKFMLIVANINATYHQIIFSEWGCYIRKWNQGSKASTRRQFGCTVAAPFPLESGSTGAATASAALKSLGGKSATDKSLLTNNNTIFGAINELYGSINAV